MASLKDLQQLTQELENLVGQLSSELENGEVDFDKLISITDGLSAQADGLAETFTNVNDALMQRLGSAKGSESSGSQQASKSQSKAGARS